MDAIYDLAKNMVRMSYEDLPPEAVHAAKKLVLDTLAVALAGSAEAGVKELVDIFRDWKGKPESTLWVFGGKVPCIHAAQVNATMSHALDFDEGHDAAFLHTGVVAVPTALAMAERIGGINGQSLIAAISLSVDLTARLCMAVTVSMPERGWHYTTIHGNFNAAAVAGKLLNLDEQRLVNAFGLAFHQAAGTMQALYDATLAKRAGPGFSSRDGIIAALMAQKGITGPQNVLQGPAGLFNVYHRGDYNPKILTAGLGEKFEITQLTFKPYSCCRGNHNSIDAALALRREHCIQTAEVEEVAVYVSNNVMQMLCQPLDAKRNPRNTITAQFSIPWSIACALSRGRVGLTEFTEQALTDDALIELSNKVTVHLDTTLDRVGGISPAVVKIKTRAGKIFSRRSDIPHGNPLHPMSIEDIITKLLDCAPRAIKKLKSEKIQKLIQNVSHLEKVRDVEQEIVGLLA